MPEKDPSVFSGKPFLKRSEFRDWLRSDNAWKASELPREKRVLLERKLFDTSRFGQLIDRKDAEKVYRDFMKSSQGAQKKYKVSEEERAKIIRLLGNFLGK